MDSYGALVCFAVCLPTLGAPIGEIGKPRLNEIGVGKDFLGGNYVVPPRG